MKLNYRLACSQGTYPVNGQIEMCRDVQPKSTSSRIARRSIRLAGYDYTQAGGYFLTIRARPQCPVFATVNNRELRLSATGTVVQQCWQEIPAHFPFISLDTSVVMPDHIHGIVFVLVDDAAGKAEGQEPARFGPPIASSIGTVVHSFKSAVSRSINEATGCSGRSVWQRNYYERVIRNERELDAVREYIRVNPERWHQSRT